jgi:hypothetical protein
MPAGHSAARARELLGFARKAYRSSALDARSAMAITGGSWRLERLGGGVIVVLMNKDQEVVVAYVEAPIEGVRRLSAEALSSWIRNYGRLTAVWKKR